MCELGPLLIEAEAIREKVVDLGRQISADREGAARPLILVGVLKGAFVFTADLARAVAGDVEVDFISAASYGSSAESSGEVRILKDLGTPIEGRDVLVVDGIVDTGRTLDYILKNLRERKPKSAKVCTLLDKPSRRAIDIPISYVGFTIGDEFVVGYGLDFNQQYRNLPSIHSMKMAI